ncbi:MAG: enoyl-CoA hydratase-related protein [Gemella sp.]|nr:enoyl-CoA hydratase-related protein [Gemella sp.]
MGVNTLLEKKDGLAIVTLNRPDIANAFTTEMFNEVAEVFEKLGRDTDVRVVLLKANGKLFSGGGDIKMFNEILQTKEPLSMELCLSPGRMVQAVRNCLKPVVVAVQGAAAGAGFGLALACDYRVVTESSKLVPAFNGIGLSGDSGLIYFLGKNLGPAKAYELITQQPFITSNQATDLSLVNKVVKDEELEKEALYFAEKLLAQPTKVLERQKDMLNRTFYSDLADVNLREAVNIHQSSKDEDFFEAVSAFLEKRKAEFKGK